MILDLQRRGYLRSHAVQKAMESVDRGKFFPPFKRNLAYSDLAQPTASGQTISAPSVVALMLENLMAGKGTKVLEIGTGCGYNTALLSAIVGEKGKIITFEKYPELVRLSKENISKLDLHDNIEFHTGDGSCGYKDEAPYERVIVTAAMPDLSDEHPLIGQLKGTGRLVAPVGTRFAQELVVFDNMSGKRQNVLPVVFVPLVGECGFDERQ